MKTLITILVSMMLTVSFSISAGFKDHKMPHELQGGHETQTTVVTGDSDSPSMMMDQIAEDPEMRQEMMHKMMVSMDMSQMMNNPEMKARMQKHVAMMQSMLDSDGMDPVAMQEMMNNPEMMSMMKMHMMCAQTADGGMMGEHSMENGKEHTH